MNKNKEILKVMKSLQDREQSLKLEENLGIIDSDGARYELNMTNKKKRALKEQLVLANHITAEGTPRAISYHAPTDNNPKEYWGTKMADGRKIKAATRDGLIDKLFNFYADGLSDLSFKAVFKAAINEKEITENPKEKTLYKNEADFHRFISSELAAKDIRTITEIDLKKYIQEWVNREHPKKKVYLAFKGVLNLSFSYAYYHKIISENPVERINNKVYMKSCDTRKAKPEEKILSPDEIKSLQDEVRHRMTLQKYGSYYINGYAMLFAIETGVRVAELCALKWEDVKENSIHIHCQQLNKQVEGKKVYYLVPYTKNEKGQSEDGREFPLTRKIRELLAELKGKQEQLRVESEFIFCHEDGEWIKTDAYITFLRRLCRSLDLNVTNNHALRMSLNSNVLIPKGVSVADRAAMLGHSIETNLRNYSFAQKDYLDNVRALLDSENGEEPKNLDVFTQGTPGNPKNIIQFKQKERPKPLKNQAF